MLFRGKMKSALLFLTTLILASCVASEEVKEATAGKKNQNAPYYWIASITFPVDLKYSDSFTEDEVKNITDMGEEWKTAVEGKKTFFTHSITTEKSSPNLNLDSLGDDGIFAIYKLNPWPKSLPDSALAVTQLFGRRHYTGTSNEQVRIEHADILVNDDKYTFFTGDYSYGYDFRTVILHEMGHFLGLLHKTGDSIMNDSILPGINRRSPTQIDAHDIAQKFNISLSTSLPMLAKSSAARNGETVKAPTDSGSPVRIIMELRASGECIHTENGTEVQRHFMKIQNF